MKLIHAAGPVRQPFDPYRDLATAVIKQAADDYRHLARKSDVSGSELERKRIRQQMTSISRFFLGDWYHTLSGMDNGAAILEMLDVEVFGNDDGI